MQSYESNLIFKHTNLLNVIGILYENIHVPIYCKKIL